MAKFSRRTRTQNGFFEVALLTCMAHSWTTAPVASAAQQGVGPTTRTFSQACFVPPAAPTSISQGPLRFFPTPVDSGSTNGNQEASFSSSSSASDLRIFPAPRPSQTEESTMALSARKKAATQNSGGGGSQAGSAPASKKVQVKLLKHVAGTGQAGEVILVSPAFYNNKLRPGKLAEQISDEQVSKEEEQAKAIQEEIIQQATALRTKLTDEGDGEFILVMWAKAGPTGQLFGGIGPKAILEELKEQVPDPYWENKAAQKMIRVNSLFSVEETDSSSKKEKKLRGDIKHTGDFAASVSLTSEISIKIPIRVISQENLAP